MNALDRFLKKAKHLYDNHQQLTAADRYHLDNPLLHISPVDTWTIRDACEGVQIFGAIGGGKTSSSGAAIAKAFLRAGFGGLVMCAKPEERQLWQQYAQETGREKSLIIFSPDQPWRFNFLDYELRRTGKGGRMTENLVSLFSHITEIVEGKVDLGGGDAYWIRAARELLRNSIELLALSADDLTLERIARLIAEAPQTPEDVGTPMSVEEVAALPADYEPPEQAGRWWRTSFCAECISKAGAKAKTARETHDFEASARYWLKTYATLADRTRSGIVSTFSGVADMLLHGITWELLCTETNLVPEVTYKHGAIIVLDLPIQEYQDVGRIIQGIFKFMFQRAILRRDVKQHPRPVFLWADESQNFISSFDFMAQAVARSARLCTVYLSQNINNYYAVLGSRGESEANALLGNFQTKIFHANSDRATNLYAAEIIAQKWMTVMNFSTSNAENSHNSQSSGGSQTVQYKVLPEEFTRLRKGGPANGLQVDGIIFQGGKVWQATGDTYLKVVFTQGQ